MKVLCQNLRLTNYNVKHMKRLNLLQSTLWLVVLGFCVPLRAEKYALLIGIDDYQQRDFISPLAAAGSDAKSLAKTLIEVGGYDKRNVQLLTSDSALKPTRGQILFELDQLRRKTKPGDIVFIGYSGHGIEQDKVAYLLPYDTDARSDLTLQGTALKNDTFIDALKRLPVKAVILAFDMCRNDPRKAGRAVAANTLSENQVRDLVLVPNGKKTQADGDTGPEMTISLFSCKPAERSYEWNAKGRGFFSYYLEEGLRQAAADRDGAVRVNNLVRYLEKAVPDSVQRETGQNQTPFPIVQGAGAGELELSRVAPKLPDGGAVEAIATTARLNITSTPPGAKVFIGNIEQVGKITPCEINFDLGLETTQKIQVGVSLAGFKTELRAVTLERGKATPLDIALQAFAPPNLKPDAPLQPAPQPLTPAPLVPQPARDWDYSRLALWKTIRTPEKVISVAFSSDNNWLAGGADGKLILWDSNGELKKTLLVDVPAEKVEDDPPRPATRIVHSLWSVKFSPDSKKVAAACWDNTIRVWDVETGKIWKKWSGHEAVIRTIAFSPDGRMLVSGGDDKTLRAWDAQSGEWEKVLGNSLFPILAVEFSKDSQVVISVAAQGRGRANGEVQTYDANTATIMRSQAVSDLNPNAILLAAEGRIVASADDVEDKVALFDAQSGNLVRRTQNFNQIIISTPTELD